MKVLVFGADGMIGSTMIRVIAENNDLQVYGTLRTDTAKNYFPAYISDNLLSGINAENQDTLLKVFEEVNPDVVINCIGVTKHLTCSQDPLISILLNALLPHRLEKICNISGARLIHISTDCVFSGKKGGYTEDDIADANDIYGKTKYLGEVNNTSSITLRTSTIGHELKTRRGLLEWFLSQENSCKGYANAIFSGLPTIILARIIRDIVIQRNDLYGLYHISGPPISKYELLKIIAKIYKKPINIEYNDELCIDRSLNSDRFKKITGYEPPDWMELIETMHLYQSKINK